LRPVGRQQRLPGDSPLINRVVALDRPHNSERLADDTTQTLKPERGWTHE
jgi:hypothetical protein